MRYFNNFKSNLNVTFEWDKKSFNFFDLNVKIYNGQLITSAYLKPVD